MVLSVNVPISTEVIESNPDCKISGAYEEGTLLITVDTRHQNTHQRLGLPTRTRLHWGKEYHYEVQELSALLWPLRYRVLVREGYYKDGSGQRKHFTTQATGIDSARRVSQVLMRAAVLLLVMGAMGYRRVGWLLEALFHVRVSKSALQRWVGEVAGQLPRGRELIRLLHEHKPITEGHLDEIFPRGMNHCVLVLKDQEGRILATRGVAQRDEATVATFLKQFKGLGITFRAFYTDGFQAYYNAIRQVFGQTVAIQYDYFHIVQNAWRHLWKWMVGHRREVKARGEAARSPWYKRKLERLAKALWHERYLLFKAEEKMSAEERERLLHLMESDVHVARLRAFLDGIWHLFKDSGNEQQARQALAELKALPVDRRHPQAFHKVIRFLEEHFEWMTAFLRHQDVQRNSLAETSMRVLRRLEIEHDGFRSEKGREDFLRIYQAVKYLGWSIYDPPPKFRKNAVG